jgi:hypothetical protein
VARPARARGAQDGAAGRVAVIASALCIVVGTALHTFPARSFTLRWQHTVEKVFWEEDYVVAGEWLYLSGARVRGSGAGMEPPPDAIKVGAAWHYRPPQRWHRELKLARSEFGSDYELCIDGTCRPMSGWIPGAPAATTLSPCPGSAPPARRDPRQDR